MLKQREAGGRQVSLKNSKKAHVAERQSVTLDKSLGPPGPPTVFMRSWSLCKEPAKSLVSFSRAECGARVWRTNGGGQGG